MNENDNVNKATEAYNHCLDLYEQAKYQRECKSLYREKVIEQKQRMELDQCTFKPKLNKQKPNFSKNEEILINQHKTKKK